MASRAHPRAARGGAAAPPRVRRRRRRFAAAAPPARAPPPPPPQTACEPPAGLCVPLSQAPRVWGAHGKALCCPWSPPPTNEVKPWWEEGAALGNLTEARSPIELAKALAHGAVHASRLTVVLWYSRRCPGCKAVHPKLHQIAGQNPNINFVRVEYNEELGKALSIRMLPFAQFHGPKGLHEAMAVSLAPQALRRYRKALERYEGHADYIQYNAEYRLPEEIQELLDDGDVTARKVARVEMTREQLEGAFTTEEGRGQN